MSDFTDAFAGFVTASMRRSCERQIKVRLNTDLTRYLAGLVKGSKGVTYAYDVGDERFVHVRFHGIGTLKCLWSSLDIIDEEYLAECDKKEKERDAELLTARKVVKKMSPWPRSHFCGLSYEVLVGKGKKSYWNKEETYDGRWRSKEILKFFEDNGIPVKEVEIKK